MATVLNASSQNNTVAANTFAPTVTAATVGNAYIVGIALVTKTRTVASIVAGAQNFTHLAGAGSSTGGFADLWWLPVITSAFTSYTITITGGLTSKVQAGMFEVSGLVGIADGTPTATDHTVAGTSIGQSMTTVSGQDFCVAAFGASAQPTSVNSPFAIQASASGGGAGENLAMATAEVAAPGTVTATWNMASEVSATAIAAFSEATRPTPIVVARAVNTAAVM